MNQHIRMISDSDLITGINCILQYIQLDFYFILNGKNISQYYSFYCIFAQINAASMRIRDKTIKKSTKIQPQTLVYFWLHTISLTVACSQYTSNFSCKYVYWLFYNGF